MPNNDKKAAIINAVDFYSCAVRGQYDKLSTFLPRTNLAELEEEAKTSYTAPLDKAVEAFEYALREAGYELRKISKKAGN